MRRSQPTPDPIGMVACGILDMGKLILYHIGHDGLLKRSAILNAPEAGMVHEFAVTDRSLILVPPPAPI